MRVVLASALWAVAAATKPPPLLWPLPQNATHGAQTLAVASAGFEFDGGAGASTDLQSAFGRYKAQYFKRRAPAAPAGAVVRATVTVADDAADLQLGVDESYTLEVSADGIAITAKTQFGAYHAMETLSQLIVFNATARGYFIRNSPWSISDAPRFAHRELLVDTARHYLPMPALKHVIQSCTYAKVNTLHWHIVDEQAFPFVAPSAPEMAKGAYSPAEQYTIDDVAEIVEFARARGIRVMMEIDTPGHASSWCKAHPEVCPTKMCLTPLRPDTEATFALIEKLMADLMKVAPDAFFHIGGDEVDTTCWAQNPDTAAWLTVNNYTGHDAYVYFVKRVEGIVKKLGKRVVGWDEVFVNSGTELDPSTLVFVWKHHVAQAAVQAGYNVLWSADPNWFNHTGWYLDHTEVLWQSMYEDEPCVGLSDAECALVLGGGGEMWAERIDASNLELTIWPRMAAVAERLWSPRALTEKAAAAEGRFANFRCYLNQQGVAAGPSSGKAGGATPKEPGSCYSQ